MKTNLLCLSLIGAVSLLAGCNSQDIPQAHKGRMFDKTGVLAFYSGGKGFEGAVLPPGTYFTGLYPEVRMLDCSTRTIKEPLTSMTKDGVQFAVDIYLSFSANCDDDNAVSLLLAKLAPVGAVAAPAPTAPGAGQGQPDDKDPVESDPDRTITSRQVYNTFVRPALGESARQAISSYNANDLNAHRDELFKTISDKLNADLNKDPKVKLVSISSLNLSNFKLPDEMANAAADRATQSVLKDKAIAEREKVTAEIETTKMRQQLAQAEAANDVSRINAIGAALKSNPDYLRYDMQQRMTDIYFHAGEHGNLIIAAPDPTLQIQAPNQTAKK